VLTIAKIQDLLSQRRFMKGGISVGQVLRDRNRYKVSRERLRVQWLPLRKNSGTFGIAKVIKKTLIGWPFKVGRATPTFPK